MKELWYLPSNVPVELDSNLFQFQGGMSPQITAERVSRVYVAFVIFFCEIDSGSSQVRFSSPPACHLLCHCGEQSARVHHADKTRTRHAGAYRLQYLCFKHLATDLGWQLSLP